MTTLNLVTIAMLLTGAAWTLPVLVRRHFRDPMRIHLFLALLLMGTGNLVSQPYVREIVDPVTFNGFSKITYNIAILSGLCLMVGFLRQFPLRRWGPPWPWEVVACVICLSGMVALTVLLPAEMRNHDLSPHYLSDWRVRLFYTLGNLYLFACYTACAILAWRHVKTGRVLRRVALTLISTGLAGLAATCIFRFAWANFPHVRTLGQPFTPDLVFAFAQFSVISLCIGVGIPWIASMMQLLQEGIVCRKQYQGLSRLWNSLMKIYPELVLDDGRRNEDRWLVNSHHVYRRYVECRDGLTRLSPYIRILSANRHYDEWRPTPQEAARLIECALRQAANHTQNTELPKEPIFVFAPPQNGRDHDDYSADLSALIDISSELKDEEFNCTSPTRAPDSIPNPETLQSKHTSRDIVDRGTRPVKKVNSTLAETIRLIELPARKTACRQWD